MGDYSIVIQGCGINRNGTPNDADEMAKALVAALRGNHHTKVKGFFCYGVELADTVEAMMPHGPGFKHAEPLVPLCTTWKKRGMVGDAANPEEACGKPASHAKSSADQFFGYCCPFHAEQLPDEYKHMLVEL